MSCAGAKFLDECPVQKMIPIYLLVGGVFTLIMNLIELVHSIRYSRNPDAVPPTVSRFRRVLQILLAVFLTVWFICGESFSLSLSFSFSVSLSTCIRVCVWSF